MGQLIYSLGRPIENNVTYKSTATHTFGTAVLKRVSFKTLENRASAKTGQTYSSKVTTLQRN